MAIQPVWFKEGSTGKTGLSLSFDIKYKVADKSDVTLTVDEVGAGCYNIEYAGTDHVFAIVNSGTDTTDWRQSQVEFNAPVGVAGSVTASVTVGTNNDKTGYGLTSDYDAAKSAASSTSVSAISSAITALKATLKSWIFKRTNTVTSGKITSYASGDGGDAVTVTVSRNVDGVTTAETPS